MWPPMTTITGRRWHMDDPLKQFSFDPPRRGFIAALKFIASEPISRLKRWDLLSRLLVISTDMEGWSYHRMLFSQVTMALPIGSSPYHSVCQAIRPPVQHST